MIWLLVVPVRSEPMYVYTTVTGLLRYWRKTSVRLDEEVAKVP